jgi:hypothetical protein
MTLLNIAKYMKCQQVKAKHQHPLGLLQAFPILEWKWEIVTMYFITTFPTTSRQQDFIIILVDKLSK